MTDMTMAAAADGTASQAPHQASSAPQPSRLRFLAPFMRFGTSSDPAVVEFITFGSAYSLLQPVTERSCLSGAEAAEVLDSINSRPPTLDAVAARLASRTERPVLCFKYSNRPPDSRGGDGMDSDRLVRCQYAASVYAQQTVEVTMEEVGKWGHKSLPAAYPLQLKQRVDEGAWQRLQQDVDREMNTGGFCACATRGQRVQAVLNGWNAADGKQLAVQATWCSPPHGIKLVEPVHSRDSFWFTRQGSRTCIKLISQRHGS